MGRKLLLFGDAGTVTGFARVHHSIGERLVTDYGWDIHVLAINHRGDDYPTNMHLYRPNAINAQDIYGRSRIVEMLGKVEPDVVWMTHDPYVLLQLLFENPYDPNRMLLQYRPLLTYIPCDGINLPQPWADTLTQVSKVVTMSKWGQAQYPGSEMVYHGVDTDQFWPVSDKRPITVSTGVAVRNKRECKKVFGFDPDGFLVLRVDKNSGRKDFASTWKALVPVMARHPDIQVHFHCEVRDSQSGVNLDALYARSEPEIARNRWFNPGMFDTWSGWPQANLNALYNAADLFVSTSRGEGFGLTLAESLAAGVPVIAQNVSAIPEVVGPGGQLLEPQRLITIPSGEDTWLADIDAFTEAIEHAYLSSGWRRDHGQAGREHVTKFSWDFAAERFNEYLAALADGTPSEGQDAVLEHERAVVAST